MPSLLLPSPLDLSSTLLGGQAFSWNEPEPGVFSGWISGQPLTLQQKGNQLLWSNPSLPSSALLRYFSLDLDLDSMALSFPADDLKLCQARLAHPGLRPVREDPWECLANFICSSLKQIVQIRQINQRLRTTFGGPTFSFPSPTTLAHAGEAALRTCGLGYRARHLAATAQRLASEPSFLNLPESCPTREAAAHLETLPGVGPKISRCVLLYAYSRWDAFPIDVWVDRLIRQLYFPRRRRPFPLPEMETWSAHYFGAYRGLAQLILFHWFRTQPKTRSKKKTKRG